MFLHGRFFEIIYCCEFLITVATYSVTSRPLSFSTCRHVILLRWWVRNYEMSTSFFRRDTDTHTSCLCCLEYRSPWCIACFSDTTQHNDTSRLSTDGLAALLAERYITPVMTGNWSPFCGLKCRYINEWRLITFIRNITSFFTKNRENQIYWNEEHLQMKVYTKRSILSIIFGGRVGVGGQIEKFGLWIKNIRGSEKKYDSYKKKIV